MSARPQPAFNVGDIVRVKTGDGRWHRIVKVEWDEGLREGFYVYHFHDGGASVAGFDIAPIEKRVLHLVLTHHWYDEIDQHGKREEYRADTEYYRKRLTELKTPLLFSYRNGYSPIPFKPYTHVCFHRGYTSQTMTWYIDAMVYGKGRKEWGAPDNSCYIIKFSERT
jgi:hypothetical protein